MVNSCRLFDNRVRSFVGDKNINLCCGKDIRQGFVNIDKNPPADVIVDVDSQALPFEDNSFDCIICKFGIEHLRNPDRAIFEVSRVLKEGGHFIALTSYLPNFWFLLNKLVPFRLSRLLYKPETERFRAYYRLNTRKAVFRTCKKVGINCSEIKLIRSRRGVL